ncbi:MAG TPA: hypothetical protein VHE78_09385 [Gemmatimonadaceae bacterium]|nr:hypothetical protein [Gemmatimonadaceae bacterium]
MPALPLILIAYVSFVTGIGTMRLARHSGAEVHAAPSADSQTFVYVLRPSRRTFGIVLLFAPSEQEARTMMEGDPGVYRALQKAELFPFRVVYFGRP